MTFRQFLKKLTAQNQILKIICTYTASSQNALLVNVYESFDTVLSMMLKAHTVFVSFPKDAASTEKYKNGYFFHEMGAYIQEYV